MSIESEQARRKRALYMALRAWDGRDTARFLTLFTFALEFLRALVEAKSETLVWTPRGAAWRN
jgi:hypothetical protein